jgi:glycine cleavage system H protein
VDEGSKVVLKQRVGNIETSKAVSDLFAPIAGQMQRINRDLLRDPSGVNADNYGNGWLFEMTGDESALMDVQAYYAFLESGWETTQRLLKGQVLKD